ncbi:MAG: aldehyde dehydrogenase [Planctomycetota bacterium]|nr:aldehyde dehydrogenase [Planctomycetota bacterium]
MNRDTLSEVLHFIDGERVASRDGSVIDNIEPATGEQLGTIASGSEPEVDAAVAAATRALGKWSGFSCEARSAYLEQLAAAIEEDLDDLAHAESIDNGKPITAARSVDIPRAAANLRFFAGAARYQQDEAYRTRIPGDDLWNVSVKKPIGVAGCISPWNLPLYLFTWKIAPALAAGCTVVGKPSEVTPVTADLLARAAQRINFPAGVLNIVQGPGATAGASIVGHPQIPALSFTGGTATGASIASVAAPMFKKTLLELGGKNPTIVFADADLDEAIEGATRAAFSNQGQICLCGSRILVESSIVDSFTERLVEKANSMRIGDPLDTSTEVGALVSETHRNKVEDCLSVAREEGGNILCGGERAAPSGRCSDGFFLSPAVVTGLDASARTNQEEIFGPVASVIPFDSENSAIAIANDVRYGLAASVWTRDIDRALRVSEKLEAGTVWVNCWMKRDLRTTFGGVKDSGLGREGGSESLKFFQEPTNVCIRFDSSG